MKIFSSIVGGLLIAFLAQIVLGLIVAGFTDTTTEAGKAALNSWQGGIFLVAWAAFGWVVSRSRSTRRVWGRTMLWLGLWSLAAPVATLISSAATGSRLATGQSDAYAAGVAIGGGAATIFVGFVAFFFAMLFLVIAFALLRGGGASRDEPTKRCPQCAEEVLAAALVCKHCRHEFAL